MTARSAGGGYGERNVSSVLRRAEAGVPRTGRAAYDVSFE